MLRLFFFGVAAWLLAGFMLFTAEDDAVQYSEFSEVSLAGFPGFSSWSSVSRPVLVHVNPTVPLDSDVVPWLMSQAPASGGSSGVIVEGGVIVVITWS